MERLRCSNNDLCIPIKKGSHRRLEQKELSMNKIDEITEEITDITVSVIKAPFKIIGGVFEELTKWM